jgi:hypothetical protein
VSWIREWLTDGEPDRASGTRPERPEGPDHGHTTTRRVPGAEPNGSATPSAPSRPAPDDEGHPGRDLGLPADGPGSVGTPLLRAGQFLLDLLVGGLVASAISFPAPAYLSLAVWAVLVTVPTAIIGQTPAMVLTGLRVVRVDGASRVGAWALARTVSLFFIVPAVIMDRDGRGLHDRVSRTVVVRTR